MGERFCEEVLRCLGAVEGRFVDAVPETRQIETDLTIIVNENQKEERVGLGCIQGVLEILDNIKI